MVGRFRLSQWRRFGLLLIGISALLLQACSSNEMESAAPPDTVTVTESASTAEPPAESAAEPQVEEARDEGPVVYEDRMKAPVSASVEEAAPAPAAREPRSLRVDNNYAVVDVFFATDRNYTENQSPADAFGTGRSSMHYGYCQVSIPEDHKIGELESPKWWKFEFRENPDKHVVVLQVSIDNKTSYFNKLAKRVRESAGKSAFIFVHGFNVTFVDAARRTAQIAYDLKFDGAPVFYSWPSKGKPAEYPTDEATIKWTESHLQQFLDDFASTTDAENIYVIAHSMGNRALTRALAQMLENNPAMRSKFKEVILTAPDIDADVFKDVIAPRLIEANMGITLYASSKDKALQLSKKFHGGYRRAGDTSDGILVIPGIESVDATKVDTSFLGHSYFADTKSVLSDIFGLIKEGKRASQRFDLTEKPSQDGRYWEFR